MASQDSEMTTNQKDKEDTTLVDRSKVNELSTAGILYLSLSYWGVYAIVLILTATVIPAHLDIMVGQSSKGRWLGVLGFGGAIIQCICGPVIGALSDKVNTPFGRRRPIMLISSIVLSVSLLGLALSAPSLKGLTIDPGTNSDDCNVDLEEKRCAPYNDSGSHVSLRPPMGPLEIHEKSRDLVHFDERDTSNFKGNIVAYTLFFMLSAMGIAAFSTAYSALVADKTDFNNRGLISGIMGTMSIIGSITGAVLGSFITTIGVVWIMVILITVFMLSLLLTLVLTPEKPIKQHGFSFDAFDCKEFVFGFIQPLKEYNFRWVFISRFLLQQGMNTVIGFMQFLVDDVFGTPNCWTAARTVSLLLLPVFISAAIGSFAFGHLSDKIKKRIPIIVIAAVTMGSVTIVMPFTEGRHAITIAVSLSTIYGAAIGAYVAVDFALVMDVLPAEKDIAKDLAVWNLALILPQAVAVPIGGILLDFFQQINCHIALGYIVVYLSATFYFYLSAALTLKIRAS